MPLILKLLALKLNIHSNCCSLKDALPFIILILHSLIILPDLSAYFASGDSEGTPPLNKSSWSPNSSSKTSLSSIKTVHILPLGIQKELHL